MQQRRTGRNHPPGRTPGSGGNIRFEIGFEPQTRVETDPSFNSIWEDGDRIGLFAVESGTPLAASGNYIHNTELRHNKGTATWTPAEDLWWPGSNGKLDFYAYDPSAINPAEIAFSVRADQSTAAGYNASDLLTAKATNASQSDADGKLSLIFKLALSLVQVEFKKDYINNIGPAGPATVTLRTLKSGATLNLGAPSGPSVVAAGNAGSITMYPVEDPADPVAHLYRALVPAQAMEEDANLFAIEQFNELYTHKAAKATFTAGTAKRYVIDGIILFPQHVTICPAAADKKPKAQLNRLIFINLRLRHAEKYVYSYPGKRIT